MILSLQFNMEDDDDADRYLLMKSASSMYNVLDDMSDYLYHSGQTIVLDHFNKLLQDNDLAVIHEGE